MNRFLSLILVYKYFIIFPLAVFEGPIIIIISSFLASQGLLSLYVVFLVGVLGDLVGDILHYALGRFGRHTFIPKYGKYLGITEERLIWAEDVYDKHLWKTLIFGKITQAPIMIILVLCGALKIDFKKFMLAVFIISIPKVLFFTLIGFYLGKSFTLIGQYLDNYMLAVWIIIIFVLIFYLIYRLLKKRV